MNEFKCRQILSWCVEQVYDEGGMSLLNLLVCPLCQGKLDYDATTQELICRIDKLAYSIKDDVPVMLPSLARDISQEG